MRGRKTVRLLELLTRKEVALGWDEKGDLLVCSRERRLMGISLEVQRNGVCLVPDVQLLQAGVYTRGRYRR